MELKILAQNAAFFAHRTSVWYYPYRTGRLVASAGDVGDMYGGVGYKIFNSNHTAPYGEALNDKETITVKRTNLKTGKTSEFSYTNRHYGWIERMTDATADNIDLAFGTRRIK